MDLPAADERTELPLCMAFVICDRVHTDPVSRKLYILGACHQVTLPHVPFQILDLQVVCSMTNGRGTFGLELRVEHEESGTIVWQGKSPPFIARSPMDLLDGIFTIRRPQIRAFGAYWFKLYANGTNITNRRFRFDPPRRA